MHDRRRHAARHVGRTRSWPAGPLHRIRLAGTALSLAAVALAVVLVVAQGVLDGGPGTGRELWPLTTLCVAALAGSVVVLYRRNRLTVRHLLAHLGLIATAALSDSSDLAVGVFAAQLSALTVGLYAGLRRLVAFGAGAQAALTGAVLLKLRLGADPGMSVGESSAAAAGMALIGGLTYAVAAVVTRHERLVQREAVVLRAGAALVAATSRAEVHATVLRAAQTLAEPGETVVPAGPDDDPARVVTVGRGDGGVRLAAGAGRVPAHLATGLRTLAPAVELAVRNVDLTERLRRQAYRDGLTGLANRVAFEERMETADPAAASVLLVDLDGFKGVNDHLGHAAGDRLLTTVAQRLTAAAGADGFVARLGGDEFVVLLDGPDHHSLAVAVAERLFAGSPDVDAPLRASIGIATGAASGARLLADADAAMYDAKAAGRGCYRVHDRAAAAAAA